MKFKNDMGEEREISLKKWVGLPVLALVGLILFLNSFTFVGAGEVGVVTRFGAVNRVVYPGLVVKVPLVEYVQTMDTRTQKDQQDASAASKDLQDVHATIAVNYHLEGSKAVDVFQNIGTDYQDKVITPAIQNIFKAVTAKYTAEELITSRDVVRLEAEGLLKNQLEVYHVMVDNFNIVNFNFSQDFNNAIEQKQVAQQNLERAKLEADTALTQATGQANAQKALKDAGSLSPEYLQFLAVQKWDGKLPSVTGGAIPFINVPTR